MSVAGVWGVIERGARWAFYLAFHARGGRGLPKSRERWEELYQVGRWDYLDSVTELPHYMVAVGYAREFAQRPSVLDLGCGHGRLLELLRAYPLGNYLGVDISEEAVRRARAHAPPDAHFVVGNYEEFLPASRFEVVMFSECLSYARDPAAAMRRYAGVVAPGGVMIVSMCYNWWQYPIWSSLAAGFVTLHSAAVTNEKGQTWHVRVLRQRSPALAGASAEQHQPYGGDLDAASEWRAPAAAHGRARSRLAFVTAVAAAATLVGFALAEAIEVLG